MREFTIESDLSPKEVMVGLHAVIIQDKSRSAVSRIATPDVYDKLMGSFTNRGFQAAVYSGDVSANSVIAHGTVSETEHGSRVHISFTRGSGFSRKLEWAALGVGVFLCLPALAAPLFALFALPFWGYFAFQRLHAKFERHMICSNIKSRVMPGSA